MNVETYEIEEIKDELGVMAADHEAMELISKLGLSGQQKLCDPETVTRFPYSKLTTLEELVYGTIFPVKTLIENYDGGVLPLRILQIVAHTKSFDFIKEVQVWHPSESRADDPVLVAVEKHPQGGYYLGPRYLLARWGKQALAPFDDLVGKAKKVWMAQKKSGLIKAQLEIQSDISRLEAIAEECFATGSGKTFSYYS